MSADTDKPFNYRKLNKPTHNYGITSYLVFVIINLMIAIYIYQIINMSKLERFNIFKLERLRI